MSEKINARGFDIRAGCQNVVFFPVDGGRIKPGLFGAASMAKFRLSGWLVWFLKSCFLVNFVIYCFVNKVRGR